MKKVVFQGAATALVTPMNSNFTVNYRALGELIDYQIKNSIDAIVSVGTTGEASTLSDEEHLSVIEFTVKQVNGRVPVIAGTGSNNTDHAVVMSKKAEQLGVDALLHVTPYYNRTSQRGLIKHFRTCAMASPLPIILYNVPSRTSVTIQPETYLELSTVENIVAVKEASGNFTQIAETLALCGDNLALYSGNDDQIVPIMALGAKGVISVLSNILPAQTHEICQTFFDGKIRKSACIQLQYMELIKMLFSDISPIPVKQALNDMGWDAGPCRLPLCEMEEKSLQKLRDVLSKYGLY